MDNTSSTVKMPLSTRIVVEALGVGLMAAGLILLLLALTLPRTCGGCLAVDVGNIGSGELFLAATSVSLLAVCVWLYRSTRQRVWASASALVVLFNTFGVPAIVVLVLRTSASLGMPIMIFTFWSSVALAFVLAVLLLRPMEMTSFAQAAINGGIGLGGLALLLTQFSAASEGYEAVIPVVTRPSDKVLSVRTDVEMVIRFDSGFVQKAYFEKGLLKVTKPPYYRELTATVRFAGEPNTAYVAKRPREDLDVYTQALSGLITLGLVRQYDVNVGTNFGAHIAKPNETESPATTPSPRPSETVLPLP